ncbi:MAG TPA: hypothetical protein VHG90_08135 [Acidimicrobiales bacterium]|nr:hypothetical protein [Acidimicrobiales bacterium]
MRMRRFQAAQPFISELEDRITEGLSPRQLGRIKRWLVDFARALRA